MCSSRAESSYHFVFVEEQFQQQMILLALLFIFLVCIIAWQVNLFKLRAAKRCY